jgi:hypothetical protein
MSVVAARQLLDRLADRVDNVFVLQDFDISGFSILGTLTADSDRYIFENQVPIIDIGLRLKDIEAMELEAETVEVENRGSRRQTLCEHGARPKKSIFSPPMTSRQWRISALRLSSRPPTQRCRAAFGIMFQRCSGRAPSFHGILHWRRSLVTSKRITHIESGGSPRSSRVFDPPRGADRHHRRRKRN